MSLYDININCKKDEQKEYIVYDIQLIRNEIMFSCIIKDSKELIDPSNLCKKIENGVKQLFEVHEYYFSKKRRMKRFFSNIKKVFIDTIGAI